MKDEATIICTAGQSESVPVEVQLQSGCCFPDAHHDPAALATLAKEMQKLQDEKFCRLPFCLTVEAEALGADINMGDMINGPRAGSYIFTRSAELAAIPPLRFDHGRIKAVLDAVRILATEGETVSLTLEGPITIVSSLIAPEQIYKRLLKKEPNIAAALKKTTEDVVAYGRQALLHGAKILSYADPLGDPDIIGPKLYQHSCAGLTRSILQQLTQTDSGAVIHLCGKTSMALQKAGYCQAEQVPLDKTRSAEEQVFHLPDTSGRVRIIGHRCFRKLLKNDRSLWEIQLSETSE